MSQLLLGGRLNLSISWNHTYYNNIIILCYYRIMESRQSCELNPNKIESATEACANAEFLLQVLDDITESIFMSSEACPRTLR